jgi:Asp-tRNA(Asn)/Glu-tRNA(Gln) amidotransferase A subunit family amidase
MSPTTIGEEPALLNDVMSGASNPVFEFKMDYFTAFPNALGIPSVTLPVTDHEYKFPTSVKLCSYMGEDYHLLRVAHAMEAMIRENGMDF